MWSLMQARRTLPCAVAEWCSASAWWAGGQAVGSLGGCFVPSRKPPGAVGWLGDASTVPVAISSGRQNHVGFEAGCIWTLPAKVAVVDGTEGRTARSIPIMSVCISMSHQPWKYVKLARGLLQVIAGYRRLSLLVLSWLSACLEHFTGREGWGMGWHGGSGSGCAVVWFIFRPNKSGADRHDETGTANGPGP